MRYVIDIDNTICTPTVGRDYHKAQPWKDRIDKVNKLYDEGHEVVYFTARGMGRFAGDPNAADYFIDDKGINSDEFFRN